MLKNDKDNQKFIQTFVVPCEWHVRCLYVEEWKILKNWW